MKKDNQTDGVKLFSRRSFIKTAAITGMGGLVAVGCGQTSQQPAPTDGKPAKPDDFKLGVILPYSKVFAVLGEHITKGMELYFESVDFTAGGRRIFLIKEDYENDAQVGMRKARKLIESDKVDMMTGIVNTGVIYALRDFIHNSKTPMIVSNAGGDALTRAQKSPYIYRSSFSNWQPGFAMGKWAAENVSKNVLVTAADYGAGRESAKGFMESFIPAGGQVVGEVYPPLQTNDFGPYLAQIARVKPEAIYCFYAGSDAVRFVNQFKEYGLKNDVKVTCAGFMVEDDVLPAQGDSALGIYSSMHWANTLNIPENQEFMKAYRERFGFEASVYAVQGYDTARVIVEALNSTKGETSNKDEFMSAISAVKFTSPRGSFSFDPETNNVVHNLYIREVQKVDNALKNVILATAYEKLKDPGK
ncbi:MAG: ABC transporter substrate-binding protein [Clostridia bacterium]|nr:ABC transporter substrate-binding protein [Clostridia bacterium]